MTDAFQQRDQLRAQRELEEVQKHCTFHPQIHTSTRDNMALTA